MSNAANPTRDALDDKVNRLFAGKVVRKDLVRKVKVGANVPVFVLEFLLGKYCASSDEVAIQMGLQVVNDTLANNYIRSDESMKAQAMVKDRGRHTFIDKVKVRLVDSDFWAEVTNFGHKNVHVPEHYVRDFERLVMGGVWSQVDMRFEYDEESRGKNPFWIDKLTPIQIATFDLEEYRRVRSEFTTDEWLDLMVRSMGYEPGEMSRRLKMLFLVRLIPLAERNYNLVELGPRGTGKSYVVQEVSPYSALLTGGTTVANLFGHMSGRQKGMVQIWDVVGFDEVADLQKMPKEVITTMKTYCESGTFQRGQEAVSGDGSIAMFGNTNQPVDVMVQTGHLFAPMPDIIRDDMAFIDRLHFYLPGWEIPKMRNDLFTDHYGFVVDYLAEALRDLRKHNFTEIIDRHFSMGAHLNARDRKAVRKTVSGLMKILFPHGEVTQDELAELLELALEGRRRVKEQLKKMGSFEYYHTSFSYTLQETGEEKFVGVPEQGGRDLISTDPLAPGTVYSAGVTSDGTVGLYRVEVSVSSGTGKLKLAGGVAGAMKESVQRAFSFLQAKKTELGVARDLDVSDLHVEVIDLLGNRVEAELGVALFVAGYSALRKAPVSPALLILGDMSVQGNIKPLRSLVEPLQVAKDNGAKRALIPIENKRNFLDVSADIIEHVDPIFFGDPKTAAMKVMGGVSPSDAPAGSRGSEWRRWDPHIHAPGTLLSNHFAHTEDGQPAWEKYLTAIESADPPVAALGITDYFSIRTYKRAREQKAKGRIPGVALVFPNVELRLDIKTEKAKPINLHLLFSPEDPQHELEIERALSRLECEFGDRQWRCTESDLTQVGRIIDPSQRDDLAALAAGANQFKVTLTQVKKLFREDEWVRRNCLVAVAGSNRDGTAGLQGDDSYALTRREIERFSHIIFAATPKQRDFWLGKGKLDRTQIETRYHSLKPCLHGSDAHREADVAAPDLERYCWLKGDATFETLRQALIEPEERVWLGPAPPPHHVPQAAIEVVSSTDTPWLARATLGLNPGLVAVIGARGSGKTALVEVIARAAGAPGTGEGESSFLSRASRPVNLLGDAAVKIVWRDGSTTEERLAPAYGQDEPVKRADVAYLSQQFVDRLCSSEGLARELRSEMERVIFDATDPIARLDSDSFSELEATLLEPARRRGDELRNEIRARTREIIKEDELLGRLPSLVKEQTEVQKKVEQAKKDLAELLPKGTHQRAKVLSQIEQAHATMQTRLEAMTRRRQALEALGSEVGQIRSTTEPRRFADMSRRHAAAELPDESWRGFAMKFSGDVDKSLAAAKGALDRSIEHATHGDPKAPVDERTSPIEDWPLNALRARRDATAREVGLDGERQKKYDLLRKSIEQSETAIRRLSLEIERAKGAQERRRLLIDARRQAYADVFDTFAEAEAILAKLYEPLSGQLKGATGALRRMEFFVHRRVDLDGWVTVGERDFLDLRLNTRLRGHGALKLEAEARLLPALSRGAAKDVAAAMDSFRSEFAEDLRAAMPRQLHQEQQRQWTQSMAEWLYSTDHIQVEYGIRFDGSAIERLSPGTRGIVLRDPSATPGCGS